MVPPTRKYCEESKARDWNWIEKTFKRIPVPYPLISFILFIISSLAFIFLLDKHGEEVKCYLPMLVPACFLVAYELAGVQYFLNKIRFLFGSLETVPGCEDKVINMNYHLKEKFTKSKLYYIILFLVIAPFGFDIELFSGNNATFWSILLDILSLSITLLILYSMAIILWIIFNISWALSEIERSYKHFINIDLFNIDKLGGLRPIRNLILNLVVFQFVAISLGIIAFINPNAPRYPECIYLIILFLITLNFFFRGWYVIHNILKVKMERDIGTINELYQQQHQRLQDIISGNDYWDKEEKLDRILTSTKFLQDEREQVLHASRRVYDFKAIFTFVITSLLPFATTYVLPLTKASDQYVLVAKEFFDQHILTVIMGWL